MNTVNRGIKFTSTGRRKMRIRNNVIPAKCKNYVSSYRKAALTVNFDEKDLMDILACPVCKGDLILNVVEENEEEVISGTLYCPVCKGIIL